jgi:hypothetical protein
VVITKNSHNTQTQTLFWLPKKEVQQTKSKKNKKYAQFINYCTGAYKITMVFFQEY